MISRRATFSLASFILGFSSHATAGDMGTITTTAWHGLTPVVSLLGGVASIEAKHSQTYSGTDDELFGYKASGQSKTTGFIGGFLGVEHSLPYSGFFVQAGIEYTYLGSVSVNGLNTVGIEPQTSTLYNYNYRLQTQQVLAVGKLLATTHDIFHPYLSVGLGGAFNDASEFSATTQETGSVNLTPTFDSNTRGDFSYSVGVGVDTNVNQHVRVGLGYQFSGFGKVSLSDGRIAFNNYTFPVSFVLTVPNAYANQFVAQISYLA